MTTTGAHPNPSAKALDSLLNRMHVHGDFPALSQSVNTINKIVAQSDESVHALSSVLLKDFSLTNKVLRVVNSATYGRFGGTIGTISRAVMILGFDAIRDLAVTLTLFEHMQKGTQSARLKEDILASYFTGIVAHRIAMSCGVADSEEGFICGIFHHLGRLMVTCYFYEESLEIDRRLKAHETEEKASRAVLGATYEELGIGIARHWHLPEKIIHSIQRVSAPQTQKSPARTDKLRLITNLASALCRVASDSPPERRSAEVEKLHRDFGACLNIGKKQLSGVMENAMQQFLAESGVLLNGSGESRLTGSIKHWSNGQGEVMRPDVQHVNGSTDNPAANLDEIENGIQQSPAVANVPVPGTGDQSALLTAGIHEVTQMLIGDYALNDLLRVIVDTMHRGMGFSQVLLCTRDARTNELRARFGIGPQTNALLKCFKVPLGHEKDVFQLALNKNADVFISNTQSDSVANRIPPWYRENVSAQAFLLLPLVINQKIIGMFYADHKQAGEYEIEPHLLQMLKTLRNQALSALSKVAVGKTAPVNH